MVVEAVDESHLTFQKAGDSGGGGGTELSSVGIDMLGPTCVLMNGTRMRTVPSQMNENRHLLKREPSSSEQKIR